MYRDMEDEVVRLGQAVARRDWLRGQLVALERELGTLQAAFEQLERQLSKEARDVERLEGRSLTRLLWSAIGQAEARLDKERVEAIEAELRVEAKGLEIEATEAEGVRLQEELRGYEGVDDDYDRAFRQKAAGLLSEGDEASAELHGLIAEIQGAGRILREVDEALEVGRLAERHLVAALEDIATIEDEEAAVMGAMVVLMSMSHGMSVPTRLEANLQRGQHYVRRYARELADIPGWSNASSTIGSHADFLLSFVNIVGGRGTAEARREKARIGDRDHVFALWEPSGLRYVGECAERTDERLSDPREADPYAIRLWREGEEHW